MFVVGVKVTQNVDQYSRHHVTYVPAMQSLKLLHRSLGGDTFTRKHMKIVAQYPLHHVTCAPAKFEGFRWRCIYKKIHNLTLTLRSMSHKTSPSTLYVM